MHFLLFIFVLPFASGFTAGETKPRAPTISQVTTIDPKALRVEWNKLETDGEPVLGYKVRLYERVLPSVIVYPSNPHSTTSRSQTWPAFTETSLKDDFYTEQIISGNKITDTTFEDLKLQTWYEVRVLAFNKNGNGPWSNPTRVKLG